jgi:RHS repeat-associated protein
MTTVANTMDFTYTFPNGSNNGNVQKITNNIDWHRTQSFTYDSLNRISTAQTNADNQPAFQGDNSLQMCWAETYTYDPWGNLLTLGPNTTTQSNYVGCTQESGFNYTGSIATNNRLAVSGFAYDAAGNMTASPGATYTYDAENHLITTAGVTYAYDGDGKRLTKSSGMMYWYGLNSDPLIETDLSNNLKAHYIFFNGQRVASENSSNSVNWYFADHLGTARLVFSLNGDDQSDFYPFGGERVQTSGAGNHYKFTGKERDSESGLDNFHARFSSATAGRFLSADPSNLSVDFWIPQTWNRYAYALNSPSALVDRNGLWPFYIHNEIIDESFPGMSKQDLQALKSASWNMDAAPGQQDPRNAFQHGMQDGSGNVGGSPATMQQDAREQADNFISQQVATAQQAQADWEAQGNSGIAPLALTAFGNALHTTTDRTSPSHQGEQPWANKPWWSKETRDHVLGELFINEDQMDASQRAAQDLFRRTFGRAYYWMLPGQPCARTGAIDSQGNWTGWSPCQ